MRTIYTILILLFLAPILSNCKNDKHRKNDVRTLEAELNLTPKQISQFDSLYNSLQKQNQIISADVNEANKREKSIALRKQLRQEITKILTPKQKKKYREIIGTKQEKTNK
jgi:hypothetical protein